MDEPMTAERIAEIEAKYKAVDYVHAGNWGKEPFDAESDIEELLAEVNRQQAAEQVAIAQIRNVPMTAERIAELEVLCKAATPGPWATWHELGDRDFPESWHIRAPLDDSLVGCVAEVTDIDDVANAEFIAASRTALPEALAEVRRLTAAKARLRALVQSREWDSEGFCLWCYALRTNGHTADCPRKVAMAGGGA